MSQRSVDVPRFSLGSFSLEGKVAVVSGGSDGIGRMIEPDEIVASLLKLLSSSRKRRR